MGDGTVFGLLESSLCQALRVFHGRLAHGLHNDAPLLHAHPHERFLGAHRCVDTCVHILKEAGIGGRRILHLRLHLPHHVRDDPFDLFL